MSKNVNVNGKSYTGVSQIQLETTAGGTALFKDVDEITTPSGTKNITANGTYDVSAFASAEVNVPTEGGGTSAWAGYEHTMQVAPIPYIIHQCETTTAKGTFTPTAAKAGTTELLDTGLDIIHFFVIMLKNPVDSGQMNGNPVNFVFVDLDNSAVDTMVYSKNGSGKGFISVEDDGTYKIGGNTMLLFNDGVVSVVESYNGDEYSALRSTNEYLWFAW